MREETFQEKLYHDMLPPDFQKNSHVTFGYQDILRIIQNHLKTFYGQRADWSQCIDAYFRSPWYDNFCHSPNRCEDIPIITAEELYKMIQENETYQTNIENFLKLNQTIRGAGENVKPDDVFCAAMMLGIAPDQKTPGLFNWIISREELSDEEKKNIYERISANIKLLSMIIDLFSTLFVPGMQITFPGIGTMMTQQKSKYFYRGENAFFGSSKPGIFRSVNPLSPMRRLANYLLLDEACFFLDQFEAVRKWTPSSVNHRALAQHYGIKTPLIDITSDLKTALFFACCKYENHKWRPMNKQDFSNNRGDIKGGDSKYGILYRSPTEITDMRWAISNDEAGINLISPIGYQPFMRCSAQHGYMLHVQDETYNLLKDPLFDKFRIEHNEDFCRWIFESLDCGAKVYPHDDIPQIEQYMEKIRNSHIISLSTFERFVEHSHYSEQESKAIKRQLQREGYIIFSGQVEHIHSNKLRKINKQYSIDVAYSKVDIPTTSRPMILLFAE